MPGQTYLSKAIREGDGETTEIRRGGAGSRAHLRHARESLAQVGQCYGEQGHSQNQQRGGVSDSAFRYQTFCGFDTIETVRRYLAVFELVYRFTPFAKYNHPLELAGYEVEKLPIVQIFRGRILGWPDETLGELVPNM